MFKNFIKRLDFGFKPVTIFPLTIALLTVPAMKWLPVQATYENHLLENFQLLILFATFILCLNSKTDKKFFKSLALVCVILFLREINCGRTVFFAVEGQENTFLSWKEIPYGYLAHPLYGLFMAGSFLYFLLSKSYLVLYNYMLNAGISVYNWIFMILGIIFGITGEKIGSPALEEMTETLFYLSFMALIYLQSQNHEYIEKVKEVEE